MKKRAIASLKPLLFAVWVVLIFGSFSALWRAQIPLQQYPDLLRAWFDARGAWGPAIYILAYTVRPVILFPAWILTLTSGVLFGPWLALVYTMIGENLSALFGFFLGRFFGRGLVEGAETKFVQDFDKYARENAFMTILLTRLLFFPFDLVNFAAGMTAMRVGPFLGGTALGIVPGVATIVFFGGGWLDPRNLIISGIILLVSLAIAHQLKARNRAAQKIFKDLRT